MQAERDALQKMIDGYKLSQAIFVAAELRLADRFGDHARHFEALAAATETHSPSLLRLLRALASAGVLDDAGDGTFALSPLGKLLQQGAEGSLYAWPRLGASLYGPWGDLPRSIRSGKPAFVEDRWQHLSDCAADSHTFNNAMAEGSAHVARALLGCCDLSPFKVLVDIGGGDGVLIEAILKAHPASRGVLFDLQATIRDARPRLEAAWLAGRCRLVEGSFFDSVPEGGDAYLLSRVLHDWNDDSATAILRNVRRAMQRGTALFVIERIIEPGRPSLETTLADLSMMVMNGGRERTRVEFDRLLAAAQFKLARVAATSIPFQIIEAEAI
jgi:hypothetical protein